MKRLWGRNTSDKERKQKESSWDWLRGLSEEEGERGKWERWCRAISHRTLEGFRGRFGVQGCYLEGRNGGSCQKAMAITYTNEDGKLYCGISGTDGRRQLNSGSIWNMEQSGFLSGLDVDFERRKSVMNLLWFLARRTWKVELSFSETGNFIHKLRQATGKEQMAFFSACALLKLLFFASLTYPTRPALRGNYFTRT